MASSQLLFRDVQNKLDTDQENYTRTELRWVKKFNYFYRRISNLINIFVSDGDTVFFPNIGNGGVPSNIKTKELTTLRPNIRQKDAALQALEKKSLEILDSDLEQIDGRTFDHIVLNHTEDIVDIIGTLKILNQATHRGSRLHTVHYNFLWTPLYRFLEKIGLKKDRPAHNWLSSNDIQNFADLCGFEHVIERHTAFIPFNIPLVSFLVNDIIFQLPVLKLFNLVRVNTFRPVAKSLNEEYSVAVCVPCRNEVGNIESAIERIPEMGKGTEIIFGDDKSTDGTKEKILETMKKFPEKNIRVLDSPGISKSFNVWNCFDNAKSDILMILDADLTVAPEELPYFYNAIKEGRADFINGSRQIYPMEKGAMRFANILGNKMFSALFSAILSRKIKDTLCGTKVLFRSDYNRKVKPMIGKWGIVDRWGDYDLIFGSAWGGMKILDLPVHYLERKEGVTKMTGRIKNGLIMLRLSVRAFLKFKFLK